LRAVLYRRALLYRRVFSRLDDGHYPNLMTANSAQY
jgi:hypothetical protein